MKKLDRRSFFKKTFMFGVAATLAPKLINSAQAKTSCEKVKTTIGKTPVELSLGKKPKLGYMAKSKKAAKGKICENCKHFCAEKKVCVLASMRHKVDGKKVMPTVDVGGYCTMFAWDKKQKKVWKAKNA